MTKKEETNMLTDVQKRKLGGMVGLLIGDALGVPYEFYNARKIPPRDEIEMTPPNGFKPTHNVPAGTYSDDGALALALLDSLLTKKKVDQEHIMRRFVAWNDDGDYAPGSLVFDIGNQTSRAILAFKRGGVSADRCGGTQETTNGNGSLMRTLPLALWHEGTDEQLILDAHAVSHVTHAHPIAEVCCALYCIYARDLLRNGWASWPDAAYKVMQVYNTSTTPLPHHYKALQRVWMAMENAPATGGGFVVDTLVSARRVLANNDNFADVVRGAIALGDDTDTTAAVAGGLAGMQYGVESIPARWRQTLRGAHIWMPMVYWLLFHDQPYPPALDVVAEWWRNLNLDR